ncbi:Conserved_hypothetical protein [Hexamita inflata]|uniref:Uncharacterized protein n=1 Tax=Hexamita inflata TaxID=28002 RepID=A0AA86PSI9_9EUKA|nr:Conserved hypothetical protein [Hexamita inflata]
MGRPFSINCQQFTQALASYFKINKNIAFDTEQQLFDEFNKVYKIHRTPIWNHIAQFLGKTKSQVKNFYFNTWTVQVVPNSFVQNKVKNEVSFQTKGNIYRKVSHSNIKEASSFQNQEEIQKYPIRPMLLKFSDFKVNECNQDQDSCSTPKQEQFISFIL